MTRQVLLARAGSLIRPVVGTPVVPAQVRTSGRVFTKAGARWTPIVDTAWGLAVRLTREQVVSYLTTRVGQGFNAVAFAAVRSAGIGPTNAYGAAPYTGTLASPTAAYWTHVDYCVTEITNRGLVAVILPCWSTGLVGGALTATNAYGYGQWLAARYGANPNIIWLLGGGDGAGGQETVWRNLASGLDATAAGTPIGYAPGPDMASTTWFNADAWADFQAISTGNCLGYAIDRGLEATAYANTGGKPWLNTAAVPEIGPICNDPAQGWAMALDVRREAYWAVLAGAAGAVYANAAVQVFETATLAPGGGGSQPPPPPPTGVDITASTYKEMALELTSTAENSTKDWTQAYPYIEDIGDGRGYTAGIVGFTSGTGDMLTLVQRYVTAAPGNTLAGYVDELVTLAAEGEGPNAGARAEALLGATFRTRWQAAATSDPVFRATQRALRDEMYWSPALTQALADGVGPLGLAIHYDISVNHGPGSDAESYGGILATARAAATRPSLGGNQATYLTALVNARSAVLTAWGDNPADGRVAMHRMLLSTGNFDLVTPFTWSIYGDNFTMASPPTDPEGGGSTSGFRYYRFVPSALRDATTADSIALSEFALLNGVTRLTGMTITATNNSSPAGEEPTKAGDNSTTTKWLSFNKTASALVYDFGTPVTATGYRLGTANDHPERDPISWTVQRSNDGSTWATVDTRTNWAFWTARATFMPDYGFGGTGGTGTDPGIPAGGNQTLGVGGIPRPAPASNVELNGSNRGAMSITSSGTSSAPRIYDGGAYTCGRITINANYIVIQNYNIRPGDQYGVYMMGHDITVQNCDIKNVQVSGDGDLNAITVFGDNNKILYNTAINFVSGDPGDSHTDAVQCWDTSSKIPTNNLWIIGNRFEGPLQSEGSPIHQCIMAEGPDSTDGGGGGDGPMGNWHIEGNYFRDDWNQCLKFDDVDNVTITRNTFAGASSKIIEATSLSSNVKYYSDNVVTGSYGSIGISVTSGAGPANPLTGARSLTPPTAALPPSAPESAPPAPAALAAPAGRGVLPRRVDTVDPNLAPPTNFAAVWNATDPPTVTCTWTPTPGTDSTEVHEFLVDPASTLKATIAYPGGSRQSRDLSGTQYLYAVRARSGSSVSRFTTGIRIGPSGQSAEPVPGQTEPPVEPPPSGGTGTGIPNTPGPWTSYLATDVATQIRHLRTLVESRPRMEPRNALVLTPGTGAGFIPAMAAPDNSSLMAYFANGGAATIDIYQLTGATCRSWWFNPRTGLSTQLADVASSAAVAFTAPTSGEDWVLVADDVARGYPAPSTIGGGGGGAAPTVNAGADVTGHPVGTVFTRTATETGTSITSRSWRITAGPTGVGSTIGTAAALSWTPTSTGSYTLQYAATNTYGTATDSMAITVGAAVNLLPWQVHNIGTGSGTGKVHMAVDVARVSTGSRQLYETSAIVAGLEIDPEYMVTADNGWVQMATRVDAPTTSGSSYARSEYREVTSGWGFNPHDNGTHWVRARVKMTSIPTDKPDLIFGQLHSSEDDVIQLQTNRVSSQIATRMRVNGTLVHTFAASYSTGTVVDYLLEILPAVGSQPARCRAYYNDLVIPAYTFEVSEMPSGSGYYWKVGNYVNSNETTESDSTRWGITHVRHIQHFHTGWQAPQNYFGIPEVNAGSDTSVARSTTFNRTATESGSSITARKWGIVDGPTGRGTSIGSAAALSWSVPSTTGVYRLRYGAQNASGWGIDDVLITVT